MSEEKKEKEVLVHKSTVTLMKGESVHDFARKINDVGKAHLYKMLGLQKEDYVWMCEVFSGSAVFNVDKSKAKFTYYALPYTRDKKGEFVFGPHIEVEKITSFKPKMNAVIQKNNEYVQKPFPNEHAARQTDPGKYDSFRRGRPPGFPNGVDAIYGILTKPKRKTEIQSIRFNSKMWTVEKAKAWLKKNKFKVDKFEAAAKPKKQVKKNFGDWVQTEKDFWGSIL